MKSQVKKFGDWSRLSEDRFNSEQDRIANVSLQTGALVYFSPKTSSIEIVLGVNPSMGDLQGVEDSRDQEPELEVYFIDPSEGRIRVVGGNLELEDVTVHKAF